MAKHTITIIQRGRGGSGGSGDDSYQNKLTYTPKKTASTKKIEEPKVSNKNIQSFSFSKQGIKPFVKSFAGIAAIKQAQRLVNGGINIYATINEASTGEIINNSNLRTTAQFITNPLSVAKDAVIFGFLESKRVARANESLNYQRQLTGNLAFSKNFNDGTL